MDLDLMKEVLYEVDWREPWLVGLLAFHAATTITVVLSRHHQYLQAGLLAVLAVLCFCTERINEYAALNYKVFAKQQYFDGGGFFLLLVFAGPLLFNCFLIVFCWMYGVWQLMVRVAELKGKLRQQKEERGGGGKATAGSETAATGSSTQTQHRQKKDQ